MAPVIRQRIERPFGLLVSGDAARHEEALQKLLAPRYVETLRADEPEQVLNLVRAGQADAAVLDLPGDHQQLLKMLRMIRRMNTAIPVVLVAQSVSRRFMEDALRLAAFSVAHKPLEREHLLIQLRRLLERAHRM